MPLSNFMVDLQRQRAHCAAVVDERGTVIGLAFREDALEEIVGPLGDEFDEDHPELVEGEPGIFELSGRMSLPEVCDRLDFELDWDEDEETDTIGGHVTARLGRLPTATELERAAPANPVRLRHRSRHASVVSRAALARLPEGLEGVEGPPGRESGLVHGQEPAVGRIVGRLAAGEIGHQGGADRMRPGVLPCTTAAALAHPAAPGARIRRANAVGDDKGSTTT